MIFYKACKFYAIIAGLMFLSGCSVLKVAGTAVGTTCKVVYTTVKVTGKVVGTTAKVVGKTAVSGQ